MRMITQYEDLNKVRGSPPGIKSMQWLHRGNLCRLTILKVLKSRIVPLTHINVRDGPICNEKHTA